MAQKKRKPTRSLIPSGRKYALLLYHQRFAMLRGPGLLLGVASYGLWLAAFSIPFLNTTPGWMYDLGLPMLRIWGDLLLFAAIFGGVIYYAAGWAQQRSYVQCHGNYLEIKTPFSSYKITYRLVSSITPVHFAGLYPLHQQPLLWQSILRSALTKMPHSADGTVTQVDLVRYPKNERQMRRGLSRYLFSPTKNALLFLVRDWMAFSSDIEKYRVEWRRRQMERERRKKLQAG